MVYSLLSLNPVLVVKMSLFQQPAIFSSNLASALYTLEKKGKQSGGLGGGWWCCFS